jgi:transposase
VLRYRNLLVRQAVQMKNKVSGLLMEAGVPYNQQKVHQTKCVPLKVERKL